MKSQIIPAAAVIATMAITLLATLPTSRGQANGSADEAALLKLAAEISAQQAQIATNQTQIDEKLAQVAEDVRQARLFVARAGGAARP